MPAAGDNAMAIATPIPFLRARFCDRCNNPLAGGKVFTYEPNSLTPKDTFTAPNAGTKNTNPISLDAAGEADVYLNGRYRIIVQDAKGVVIDDRNDVGSWFSDSLDSQFQSINEYLDLQGTNIANAAQLRVNNELDTIIAATQATANTEITNLQAAIELFASGGATEYNWLAQYIAMSNGRTLEHKLKEQVSVQDFMTNAERSAWALDQATYDVTRPFLAWAAAKGNYIADGHYVLKKQISLIGTSIITTGNVILDFSSATNKPDFPDNACFYATGGNLTALPPLSSNVINGADTLSFTAPHGLQSGDVIVIYNPADGSYNAARTYYRAGEFLQVSDTTSTNVYLSGSVYAEYIASEVTVYKLPAAQFVQHGGNLTVIGSINLGMESVATTKFQLFSKVTNSKLIAKNSAYASIFYERSYNISGNNYTEQSSDGGTGTQYGVVFANVQKVSLNGDFNGGRHGVTLGGGNSICCVPCRDIYVGGSFSNSPFAAYGTGAVNAHGNAEHYHFSGLMNGGFSGGGNYGKLTGTLIAKLSQSGIAILMAEMLGTAFDFSGVSIRAFGDPSLLSGRAVIDCGGNTTALDANTKFGGVFDVSRTKVYAPDAKVIFKFFNRGCNPNEAIVIDASNLTISKMAAAAISAITINTPTFLGKKVSQLRVGQIFYSPTTSFSGAAVTATPSAVDSIVGWTKKGVATGVAGVGDTVLSIAVAFDYPAPQIPVVSASANRAADGGKPVGIYVSSVSVNGFTINIKNSDAVAFGSAWSFAVNWVAAL